MKSVLLVVLQVLIVAVLVKYQEMVIEKMENKDMSARIMENHMLLIQFPFRQEHKELKVWKNYIKCMIPLVK